MEKDVLVDLSNNIAQYLIRLGQQYEEQVPEERGPFEDG